MTRSWVTCVMAAAVAWIGATRAVRAQVAACQPPLCAEVKLLPDSLQAQSGQTVTVNLNFTQAPNDGQQGGPDETAALALSIGLGTGTGAPPLRLADCTAGSDGLPASVHPSGAISNFKVVVENAYCANGRPHCLCPDSGDIVPDSFINLVIYGPNPLPSPGPNPIEIPILPAGPLDLVAIDLRAQSGGTDVPLHIYNQVQETQAPQFRALLSIGDKIAVDETCVPVSGQPPCGTAGAVSQVVTTDSTVTIAPGCFGDCTGDNAITQQDLVALTTAALGGTTGCQAGNGGTITVADVVAAVPLVGTQCQ